MIFNLIIFLLILVIISFIIFKLFKKIIMTIISITIILAIFLIIIIYLTYTDINNLQNEFLVSDNLILLEDNQLLTGLTLNSQKNQTNFLSEQELTLINPSDNNYYKTITLKMPFLEDNLEENIKLSNEITLTKSQIISLMKSNEPIKDFKEYTNNQIIVPETDKVKFKAQILTTSLKNIPFNLILKEYKNKNLEIYPETITFKIIRLMPKSILNNIQ